MISINSEAAYSKIRKRSNISVGIKCTQGVHLTIYNIFHPILILFIFFNKFNIIQQQKTTFIEYKTRNEKQYSNYKPFYCSRYGLHVFRSRLDIDKSKLRKRIIGKAYCSVHDSTS
jgi:hypothetical protein